MRLPAQFKIIPVLITIAPWLAQSQSTSSPPSVSQVLLTSTVSNQTYANGGNTVTLSRSVPAIFTEAAVPTVLGGSNFGAAIGNPANYQATKSILAVGSALNASIATALAVIPLASPASGVIFKTDAITGAELPVNSTLGPVFTERAETIGKNKFYVGITRQDFHFSSLDGQSLNNLQVLSPGGVASNILSPTTGQPFTTVPATFNIGMDVRLSQNTAFFTYGATNRFDISVGLPMVHAAVTARTYNGQIYSGVGAPVDPTPTATCWCVNTFTPGTQTLVLPDISQSSLGKTGFGDMLLRFKGTAIEKQNISVAFGLDLRLPTGDAQNFLGTGATGIKPFMAVSLYSKPLPHGIVFAPHFNLGWQYSGKSILGGTLSGTPQSATLADGTSFSYTAAPFTATKDFLPDVLSWAVGTEVAFGRKNTLVVDLLGNQIGSIHGIPTTIMQTVTGANLFSPVQPYPQTNPSGLVDGGRTSFGQYNGAFGWKTRIVGNFIATVNFLVRFDNNGLTAKVVPLYGVGYSF